MLLLIISLFLGIQSESTPDSTYLHLAQKQAQSYVHQIQQNQNTEINLWALATLCDNEHNTELQQYINTITAETRRFDYFDQPFCSEQTSKDRLANLALQTGFPGLLLGAILQESDSTAKRDLYLEYKERHTFPGTSPVKYDELITKVLEKDSLSTTILPRDQFYFPHFLLTFNNDILFNQVITPYYLKKINESWPQEIKSDRPPLISSLAIFTLLRTLYWNNQYSKIQGIYSDLIAENLFPISETKLRIYRFLDYSMSQLGYYDRALNILRTNSIPLAKFLVQKQVELSLRMTQGIDLYRIGKIREAINIYEDVLDESETKGIDISKTSLFNNLSIAYAKSGNFDKHLNLQFRALKLAENKDNYAHQFEILRNLHVYYRRNGDLDSSKRYINQALQLAKRNENTENLGLTYTSLGVLYRDLKSDPDSANIYFNKAQATIENLDNFNLDIILLRERAKLEEDQNNLKNALAIYDEMQQLSASKENVHSYLDALIDETKLRLQLNQMKAVEQNIAEIKESNLSSLDFSEIVKAHVLEANYLIKRERRGQAYDILKPTINQVVERAENSTDLQSGFWNVEQEYIDAFELYVNLLINTGRADEAVLALDQLKTINNAALYQDPMVKSSQLNESELTQFQQLSYQLDQLRKQLLSASGSRRVELQSRIDRLNAQKRVLDRKITSLADQPTINIHQVQRRLTTNDLILHITELKNTYYLATISRRKVRFQQVDLDEATRHLFVEAIQDLSRGETDLNKLYKIGQILNVSDLPSQAENLILIPDSYLFQLPMDIIPTSRPANNYSYGGTSYLIENYKTEYLTSLNELVYNSDSSKEFSWDYVGFGITNFDNTENQLMPLPYASREVMAISRELNNLDRHRTILEKNSTEEVFRQTAPRARILHLATHSKVSEQDPLFSTIYMSNPESQAEEDRLNSQIFAYELFEMNLSNSMIMLNSCESGSGSYLQGSGIIGISRALRYAGAESLVLNLWSVNDMMASDFAIQFYKALNKGDTKSEALRKAKVQFLKQKNANPHYWGPYMMIGSNRPVVEPHRSANLMFATGFMIYLTLMMGLSYMAQTRSRL